MDREEILDVEDLREEMTVWSDPKLRKVAEVLREELKKRSQALIEEAQLQSAKIHALAPYVDSDSSSSCHPIYYR